MSAFGCCKKYVLVLPSVASAASVSSKNLVARGDLMVSMMSAGQYTLANVAKIAEDLTLQVMNTNQFVKKTKCNTLQFSQMISTQQATSQISNANQKLKESQTSSGWRKMAGQVWFL